MDLVEFSLFVQDVVEALKPEFDLGGDCTCKMMANTAGKKVLKTYRSRSCTIIAKGAWRSKTEAHRIEGDLCGWAADLGGGLEILIKSTRHHVHRRYRLLEWRNGNRWFMCVDYGEALSLDITWPESATSWMDLHHDLSGIPFLGLPKLCFGYISPEAIVALISVLSSLDSLALEFQSPQPCPDQRTRRPRPPEHSVIPAPTRGSLFSKWVIEYLEDLVTGIDTPQLDIQLQSDRF